MDILSILVIRLSSMGDVVLTTALLQELRESFPNVHIAMVTQKSFADVIRFHPSLSAVYEYDKEASETKKQTLRGLMAVELPHSQPHFDVCIDLQDNRHSKFLRKGLADKILTINKHRWQKLRLVYTKTRKALPHVTERYRDVASSILTSSQHHKNLEIWLPEERENTQYFPQERAKHRNPLVAHQYTIALAPGAHHATKRWSITGFMEVAWNFMKQLHARIVLVGGQGDAELCQAIQQNLLERMSVDPETAIELKSDDWCQDFSGDVTILETLRVLDSTAMLVTNDTGVMHIAAARQIPVVAVFGSTTTDLGFTPYGVPHEIVQQKGLECRPCSHIGRADCPRKHFRCMNDVMPEQVFSAGKLVLETVYGEIR
jgi:heptosyltransferase-2